MGNQSMSVISSLRISPGSFDRVDGNHSLLSSGPGGPNVDSLAATMMVLGTSNSGKSTVLSLLAYRLVRWFDTEAARTQFTEQIRTQIHQDMQRLVEIAFSNNYRWSKSQWDVVNRFQQSQDQQEALMLVAELWRDPGLRELYLELSSTGLMCEDSVDYFFDKVAFVARPGWVPNFNDVLRHRSPTTTAQVCYLPFADVHHRKLKHAIRMVDLGGSRELRRAWFEYFDDTEIVMYVAALSDYSCVVGGTNALSESVMIFRSLIRCKWFENKSIVLVLTKDDIFRRKIQKDSIGNHFQQAPQGIAGCQYPNALEFIKSQFFEQELETPLNRKISACVVDAISKLETAQEIISTCQAVVTETARRTARDDEAAAIATSARLPVV